MTFIKIDITGKKYNKLTAIKLIRVEKLEKYSVTKWLFKCDCGKEKIISKSEVVSGNTKSCGCSIAEFMRQARIKKGTFGKVTKHTSGYLLKQDRGSDPYIHRQVMAEELSKYPNPDKMHVHHINKNKTDNRKENLMVVTPEEHARLDNGWELREGVWFKPCKKCHRLLEANRENFYFRSLTQKAYYICKQCTALKNKLRSRV